MQVEVTLVVLTLFALGTIIPRIDQRPWQGGFVLYADSKQPIKVIYRIWASWRLERTNHHRVLAQHFQVLRGNSPRRRTKRIL